MVQKGTEIGLSGVDNDDGHVKYVCVGIEEEDVNHEDTVQEEVMH